MLLSPASCPLDTCQAAPGRAGRSQNLKLFISSLFSAPADGCPGPRRARCYMSLWTEHLMQRDGITVRGAAFRAACMAACLSADLATAQTRLDLRTQSRNVDFSSADSARPFKAGP